jgi:hypothetical protein
MSAIAPLSQVLLSSITKADFPDRIMGVAFDKQFSVRREIVHKNSDGGIEGARLTINRFNTDAVAGAYHVLKARSFTVNDLNKNRSHSVDTAEDVVKRMVNDLAYLYDDSEVNIA